MFDLDQQLASWKRSIADARTLTADDIAELEMHLRDTVEQLTVRGLTQEEALLLALRRIGDPCVVAAEYEKVNPGLAWARRWHWMTAGFLIFSVLLQGIDALSYSFAWLALPTGKTMIGVSIVKLGCFAALALGMLRCAQLPSSGRVAVALQRASTWFSRHPVATAGAAFALLVGFRLANSVIFASVFRGQHDAAFALANLGAVTALVLPVLLFLWGRYVNPSSEAERIEG